MKYLFWLAVAYASGVIGTLAVIFVGYTELTTRPESGSGHSILFAIGVFIGAVIMAQVAIKMMPSATWRGSLLVAAQEWRELTTICSQLNKKQMFWLFVQVVLKGVSIVLGIYVFYLIAQTALTFHHDGMGEGLMASFVCIAIGFPAALTAWVCWDPIKFIESLS